VNSSKIFHSLLVGLAVLLGLSTIVPAIWQSHPVQAKPALPQPTPPATPEVGFFPTPENVVERMLELVQVNANDIIYDLGSGDGRIVITAAKKYGARGTGIEIKPSLIELANLNARQANVSDRVKFVQQDLFTTDFRNATVVTLYLLPSLNLKLRPILLRQLKPGTRIVSHAFDMGDWKPDYTETIQDGTYSFKVFVWRVPEKVPERLLRE
jgi:tRNA G37 N-methylase Trm5